MNDTFVTGMERDRMQSMLAEGEKLLWCAKPQERLLTFGAAVMFLVGGVFAVVPLALLFYGLPGMEVEAVVFLSVFALGGLFFMIGVPLLDYRSRCRWLYGLTDRRAILLHGKKIYEYPLAPYMALSVDVPEGKRGSIVFERREKGSGEGSHEVEYGFLRTPEAAEALRLMREMLDGKVSEEDKPAELLAQEYDEECKRLAAYLPWLYGALAVACVVPVACVAGMIFYEKQFKTFFVLGVVAIVCGWSAVRALRKAKRGRKLGA